MSGRWALDAHSFFSTYGSVLLRLRDLFQEIFATSLRSEAAPGLHQRSNASIGSLDIMGDVLDVKYLFSAALRVD